MNEKLAYIPPRISVEYVEMEQGIATGSTIASSKPNSGDVKPILFTIIQ